MNRTAPTRQQIERAKAERAEQWARISRERSDPGYIKWAKPARFVGHDADGFAVYQGVQL